MRIQKSPYSWLSKAKTKLKLFPHKVKEQRALDKGFRKWEEEPTLKGGTRMKIQQNALKMNEQYEILHLFKDHQH